MCSWVRRALLGSAGRTAQFSSLSAAAVFALVILASPLPPAAAAGGTDYVVSYLSRRDTGVRYPGQAISVTWAVTNVGTAAPSLTSQATLYLSLDQSLDESDIAIGQVTVPPLTPGSTVEGICQPVAIPGDVAPGTYYLIGVCDSTGVIDETDETNNTRVAETVEVQATPEFVISVSGVGQGSVLVNGAPQTLPWSGQFQQGAPLALTAIPDTGWFFSHWSGSVSTSLNSLGFLVDQDLDLQANFTQQQYMLAVAMVGQGSVMVNGTTYDMPWGGEFPAGSVVDLEAVPADGWAFAGWLDDASGTDSQTSLTMNGDSGVVAQFTQVTHTLSLTGVGQGAVQVNGTLHLLPWSGLVADGSQVTLQAVPADDWQFTSWSGDVTGSANPATLTMDSDKAVTATFSATEPTLTVDVVGQGTVSVNGTPQTAPISMQLPRGSQVTLQATAADGWQFGAWSGDVFGLGTSITFTLAQDRNVTATFLKSPHTLSIATVGQGSVLVNGTPHALPWSGTVADGESVTLQAVPTGNWVFSGWTGSVTDSANPITLVVTSDESLTANFAQVQRVLNLTGNASCGMVAVNGTPYALPASGQIPAGTTVTLTALPKASHRLEAWSGDLTGDQPVVTLVMDGDKTVNASFVLDLVDIDPSLWAYDDIHACVDAGIVRGYPDRTYRPDFEVGRDQMAVYVARGLAGGDAHVPSGPVSPTFSDVPADSWAFKYIEYCAADGIVVGYPDGSYRPGLVVDRGQMAVYVSRSIAQPVGDAGLATFTAPITPSFVDVATTSWSYRYIEFAKAHGVVQGYPDGLYHPELAVTRDQMAVYIQRTFDLPIPQ